MTMPQAIPASIEVSPKQAIESQELGMLFPPGTHVYVTDIGTDSTETLVRAAARLRQLDYEPVPHVASRRMESTGALEERIRRLSGEAGVRDVLIIGGGLDRPAGEFTSTMDILETGVLDRNGIKRVGVAGHPEGSPDFSDAVALDALRLKRNFAERSGAELRIVTQFGFDAEKFVRWAEGLKAHGLDVPVHLGVAGPAALKTLMKFAAMCGVGASLSFLKRNALKVTQLAVTQSPETVVGPIEKAWRDNPGVPIAKIHVFPFGGLAKSSEWLRERGSWPTVDGLAMAAE